MHYKPSSDKNKIRNNILWIFFVFLYLLPLFFLHSLEDNYSGFISRCPVWTAVIYSILIIARVLYLCQASSDDRWMITAVLLMILTVCIPYQDQNITGFLHLLCSYGAFLIVQWKILINHPQPSFRNIYFLLLITVGMLCISSGRITGLAEALYSIGADTLITYHPAGI